MSTKNHPLDTLEDIKQMMERSSRFISLSGLSGVSAGFCALAGAWFAMDVVDGNRDSVHNLRNAAAETSLGNISIADYMGNELFWIAVFTFCAALITAFIFTYLRSKKKGIPIWGATARRVAVNLAVPLFAGGVYLIALIQNKAFGLIAPGCLIFYGLAVLNASKYTLAETKYLGYSEIAVGIISLFFSGEGIWFWAFGFGLLHIIYGTVMWWRYERNEAPNP